MVDLSHLICQRRGSRTSHEERSQSLQQQQREAKGREVNNADAGRDQLDEQQPHHGLQPDVLGSEFRDTPRSPGLNYERIEGGKDPFIRSVRVDQDIRCIVRAPDTGDTYVLLWIDKYDDAYQWARRRTCHGQSGPTSSTRITIPVWPLQR